jgi:hypothetical protein
MSPWAGTKRAPPRDGSYARAPEQVARDIQRRMLDAYVAGCTGRESVYRQHAQFVQAYQFWGHWAHKRTEAQGRIYYLSPEVILGNARGRAVEPSRLRRVFRLRQLTRQVRLQGQIRLHNFGLYVDHGLSR